MHFSKERVIALSRNCGVRLVGNDFLEEKNTLYTRKKMGKV